MEKIIIRFSHLAESIFDKLDDKTLTKCRSVSKKWKAFIDNQKTLHVRKIKTKIEEFHEVGDAWNVVFKKGTTQEIMNLDDAVRKFYIKDSNLKYYKGLTPLHVTAGAGKLLLLSNILLLVAFRVT